MSKAWAERQRRTNRLVRLAAGFAFQGKRVSPDQLYGLCRLTWITSSFVEDDAGYIASTKLPALGDVFNADYAGHSLKAVARDIRSKVGKKSAENLVLEHSGFTHFYRAYRNTARAWIESSFRTLQPLFRSAYELETDDEGRQLVRAIGQLPRIPMAGSDGRLMRPENLLTPAFFALDERLRFPLINGNKGVQLLLRKLKVSNASLERQYDELIALYGTSGIADAADLDQVGNDLPDLVPTHGGQPTKQLLTPKATEGHELTVKDERDIERLQQALTVAGKRLHNKLTNQLGKNLVAWTLLEGSRLDAMFDVLVKLYDDKNDLLVEAKSSVDAPQIRMAVGQLFDYWFRVKGACDRHLAILLPEKPDETILGMLDWLRIGVLWFEAEQLRTATEWLSHLATE